jgi:hypothetical protein
LGGYAPAFFLHRHKHIYISNAWKVLHPLPASTNPVQVVQAVPYLEQQATDPAMTPAASLDDSIIASLNYPELLRLMRALSRYAQSISAATPLPMTL